MARSRFSHIATFFSNSRGIVLKYASPLNNQLKSCLSELCKSRAGELVFFFKMFSDWSFRGSSDMQFIKRNILKWLIVNVSEYIMVRDTRLWCCSEDEILCLFCQKTKTKILEEWFCWFNMEVHSTHIPKSQHPSQLMTHEKMFLCRVSYLWYFSTVS